MIKKITRLPLSLKLFIIILIPVMLMVYFAALIYEEKTNKIDIINKAIHRVTESANVQRLVFALAMERRSSFNYMQQNETLEGLEKIQFKTDSLINQIENSDANYRHFTTYTFLNQLAHIRSKVKNEPGYPVEELIQYYTDAINRVNFLDASVLQIRLFKNDTSNYLETQNITSFMLTAHSNMRSNIYNILYSRKSGTAHPLNTAQDHRMFKSYEAELRNISSSHIVAQYDSIISLPFFKELVRFLDKVYSDREVDNTYEPRQWWAISNQALMPLRNFQTMLFEKASAQLKELYAKEVSNRKKTMILLFISIGLVITITIVFALIIIKMLKDLELAAYKISKGATGITFDSIPLGVLGNVARSILKIEENNLQLANAAREIGKENFDVQVIPRSESDVLGHSLKKMKHDLKKFNSQKEKIQKETMQLVVDRDEFFSMTSHELKTPVTSLKAYTQLLLMDESYGANTESRVMLEKMEKQIEKLVKLINDLLDASKMQYGILDYQKAPLKLNALVREVVREISLSNNDYKIIFQKNVNGQLLGDEDRIRQVIFNLINNAIKYSPVNKEIIIRLEKIKGHIIFSIKDFGYGIREEDQPRIFDRFFRSSGDNLNTYPGLGVGLYISNEIIKRHGGRMWVESEHKKGSTFYFELPLPGGENGE